MVYSSSYTRTLTNMKVANLRKSAARLTESFFIPKEFVFTNNQGKEVKVNFDNGERNCIKEDHRLQKDLLIDKIVYVCDKHNISRRAYHQLSQEYSGLPTSYQVFKRKQEVNAQFDIHECVGLVGVWKSLEKRLCLPNTHSIYNDPLKLKIFESAEVNVKLTGDGTTFGKRMHVMNFAFSIIGENHCAGEGSHLLAVIKVPEKYDQLSLALQPLIEEVSVLKKIKVEGHDISVNKFLGGDLKFLNLVMGIQSFGAKYCCLWCTCPSELRWDLSKKCSMTDIADGARTIDSIIACQSKKRFEDKKGCFAAPLFPTIPVENVVPDTLHLFLRLSDQLVSQLVTELLEMDNISKRVAKKGLESCHHVAKFQSFVNSLGIEWQFFLEKGNNKISSRDFTGPEHKKVLENIKLDQLVPNHPKLQYLQKLWSEVLPLMHYLQKELTSSEIDEFQKRARDWLHLFVTVYPSKDVTPYMHNLVSHFPKALRLHGNLAQFSQQGLEKLNDRTTVWYYRSSHHIGVRR
ncbi:hypothetical protein HOLleu_26283 [Holothuria leucospilota]|uniref:Uncharacterized protein n=1 Tax=Holothuria leucospilota TaxID=206669 RepID=A0A9Q1BTP6_HOLLE|nr:hypothetical protein HOLleu_26283 [Holothuria leucospilota]